MYTKLLSSYHTNWLHTCSIPQIISISITKLRTLTSCGILVHHHPHTSTYAPTPSQALDGFLLVLDSEGTILYVSDSITNMVGLTQVHTLTPSHPHTLTPSHRYTPSHHPGGFSSEEICSYRNFSSLVPRLSHFYSISTLEKEVIDNEKMSFT